ncbi:MAG: LPS-assembly protein LptD, partial [Candidatus Methylomirabilales bacterium]
MSFREDVVKPLKGMRELAGLASRKLGVVLAVLVVGIPCVSKGQPKVEEISLPFRIAADAIEVTEGKRFLRARGDVRISREDWTLYADEVEVDQQEEVFVARGSVLLFDRGNQIQGSSIRYDYGTGKGVIYEAHGLILPSTTFTSQELYREDERTYRIVKGRYTSCRVCQPPPYDWEIRASEMTVHPGEFLWGKNGTFWLKGVPVLYTPVFRHALTDRQTGFLTPTFGSNAQEGFIY